MRSSRLLKKFVMRPIFLMFASATRGSIGDTLRHGREIRFDFASSSRLQTDSSRCGQNLRNADEIVGGGRQHEEPFDQRPSTMACLAQTADGLDPAEGFLDPLPLDGADAITGVTGGAGIDRRAAVGIVLRHMRRTATFTAAGHEVSGIVVLVAAHR